MVSKGQRRRAARRRFTDEFGLRYSETGEPLDSRPPEVIARVQKVVHAWRVLNETGDRSLLVQLGQLPPDE